MKAIIDADACVGCGLCADLCPHVFTMNDDVAEVVVEVVPEEAQDACREATDACPVTAIRIEE